MSNLITKVKTPIFRVVFPHVFTPQANLQGKLKYSITMLFPNSTNLDELKTAAQNAAVNKWGQKIPASLRSPFRMGEEKKDKYPCFAGCVFINATSNQKPGVVDGNVMPIMDQSEFYSGCYAIATLNAFAYSQAGNMGVSFGLNNLQKIKDGEPLAGTSRPEDDFKSINPEQAASPAESKQLAPSLF